MTPLLQQRWTQFAWDSEGTGQDRDFGAWSCGACGRPITGEVETDRVMGPIPAAGRSYPQADRRPTWPANAPEDVRKDATAAHRCFAIGEWRASATMARRALQGACFDKKAPDARLEKQIDALADAQVITEQMRQVAHRLRVGGNLGAHPDKDGLKDVTEKDAKALLLFLDDFMRYVYEIPGRLERLSSGDDLEGERDGG